MYDSNLSSPRVRVKREDVRYGMWDVKHGICDMGYEMLIRERERMLDVGDWMMVALLSGHRSMESYFVLCAWYFVSSCLGGEEDEPQRHEGTRSGHWSIVNGHLSFEVKR